MNLELTKDEAAFRDEVRAFLAEHLPENLRQAGRLTTSVFTDRDFNIPWHKILHAKGWGATMPPYGARRHPSPNRPSRSRFRASAADGGASVGMQHLAAHVGGIGTGQEQMAGCHLVGLARPA